jgi:hypothetical protein
VFSFVKLNKQKQQAANVLLGQHFNPRLADFGLSVRWQSKAVQASLNTSVDTNASSSSFSCSSSSSSSVVDTAPLVSPPRTPQHQPARYTSSPFLPSAHTHAPGQAKVLTLCYRCYVMMTISLSFSLLFFFISSSYIFFFLILLSGPSSSSLSLCSAAAA